MDLLAELLKAALTLGALAVIMVALAALFMIVFVIATGIDDTIQS